MTPLPPQQLEVSQQQNATPSPVTAPPSAVTPGTPAGAGAQGGPLTPTIGTVQAQNPQGQKQMVEVKSLGQNTVTFKGNQMIVSGPDIAQAQLIAKQLSSGAAKLATLNGKQVLISTQPTVQKMAQAPTTAPPASTGATPTTTMTSTAMTTAPQVSLHIFTIDGAVVAVILKKYYYKVYFN